MKQQIVEEFSSDIHNTWASVDCWIRSFELEMSIIL